MSKQRWKDSLPDMSADLYTPEGAMRAAIFWLAAAIDEPAERQARRRLAAAGAYIRAARKGLRGKSQRIGDFHSEDAALLTGALRDVTEALDAHRFADGTEAHSLRCAEAALRTMWKRAQS